MCDEENPKEVSHLGKPSLVKNRTEYVLRHICEKHSNGKLCIAGPLCVTVSPSKIPEIGTRTQASGLKLQSEETRQQDYLESGLDEDAATLHVFFKSEPAQSRVAGTYIFSTSHLSACISWYCIISLVR